MKLSVVATLYQSALYVREFYERTTKVAKAFAGEDYEIILVNDGSPDNSLELSLEITKEDSHLVVIDLSRNFGHHKAIMTGLQHSRGDLVFLIDSDLEEEPEWLDRFAEDLKMKHADVIFGIQKTRKGALFEKYSGLFFYKLFRLLSGLGLPENVVTARLMKEKYVKALLMHQESEVFLAGLWHITGFRQVGVFVEKHNTSPTTYTLLKKISLLINSLTSFSNAPLIGIFYFGLFILSASFCYIGYLLINRWFLSAPLSGWTSVMASIWLLGGLIISLVGVLAIYISKVFLETKNRPYTIIREVYGKNIQ